MLDTFRFRRHKKIDQTRWRAEILRKAGVKAPIMPHYAGEVIWGAADHLDIWGTSCHKPTSIGIVRYRPIFGERKKIFNVPFRNIRGGLHNFQETWPDEGDVNMYELARTFHDVGYEYMLMPDHAPLHPDDVAPEGGSYRVRQAFAFQYGYIIAMIQAMNQTA